MPWSEWITPDPSAVRGTVRGGDSDKQISYVELYVENTDDAGATALQHQALADARTGVIASGQTNGEQFLSLNRGQLGSDPQYEARAQAQITQRFYSVGLNSDPAYWRDDWPSILDTLEYGVDFTEIPDTDYEYVQYEDGHGPYDPVQPNVLYGWDSWNTSIDFQRSAQGIPADSATPPNPTSIPLRFARIPGLVTPEWFSYSDGETVTEVDPNGGTYNEAGDRYDGTAPVTITPPAPEVWQYTLLVQPATLGPLSPEHHASPTPPMTGYGSISRLDQSAWIHYNNYNYGNPLYTGPDYRYQQPRFRYWIPGPNVPPPLRQKQRDDGLARSAVRARSTHSVQMSLRQKGYR